MLTHMSEHAEPTVPTHKLHALSEEAFSHHQPTHQHHFLHAQQWHHEDDYDAPQHQDDDNDEDDETFAPRPSTVLGSPQSALLELVGGVGKAPRKTKREIFICPEVHCGKQFPRSFALRRHMRIHTGNKPYACDFDGCPQKFNTSGNLSRHKRIHSGERPYPCVYASCGKRFNTSTKLKRHMRIHFPDGQNLFQCVEAACAWACDNYKEYVQHQKLHSSIALGVPLDQAIAHDSGSSKKASAGRKVAKPKTTGADQEIKTAAAATVYAHASAMTGGSPTYARRPEYQHHHEHHQQHSSPEYADRDYDDRRTFGHTFALSASLLHQHQQQQDQHHQHRATLHEKDLELDHENEYQHHNSSLQHQQHERRSSHVKQEDRPRLPFPTQAFPSESTFHHHSQQQSAHSRPPAYYEHASSSYFGGAGTHASYMRGPHDGYASHSSHHTHQDQQHHHHHDQHAQYETPLHYGGHHSRRGSDSPTAYDSPPSRTPSQVAEDVKYAYATAGIAPTPEFTGEELSAVLELMKDS